jgi:hemoglobin-like flavoprotein
MDCEPKARQLFDKLERSKRRKGLLKALEVIVSSLDDPFRLLTQLKRYSTMILIWGVEAKHVRAFSLSLANSLKAVLGSDIMTSDSKETWYLVVQRLADTLMGTFGELRDGTVGDLHRKSGSAWKRWKATLSHDTIHLVADHDVRSRYLPCFTLSTPFWLCLFPPLFKKLRLTRCAPPILESAPPRCSFATRRVSRAIPFRGS